MSLYGMMRTGVSGMSGQSNRLASVADNIANSSTTGYKRSSTAFSTLVIPDAPGTYSSGGVTTTTLYEISNQGVLNYTTSSTDLAVNGDGFFVVQDASGNSFMTRSGSFVPDGEGRLVNSAGYYLTGYSYENGEPTATANGYGGLEVITLSDAGQEAVASTEGTFAANLPSDAEAGAAGSLPSDNAAGSSYTAKSSLVAYDSLGSEVMLDVYFTKTGDSTWEVSVYNQADAAAGSNSFPYSSAALVTQELTFDPATGQIAGGDALTIPVPGGEALALDMSGMSQLADGYAVYDADVNGNAPNDIINVEIDADGTVNALFEDGSIRALYKIALATVESPDRLTVLSGNVYAESTDSGAVQVGFAGQGGLGDIVSGALESSNVDLASELTDMIEAQRNYTANSKVFQTGSELLDVLINLKR